LIGKEHLEVGSSGSPALEDWPTAQKSRLA
jgi:hypothetical protein